MKTVSLTRLSALAAVASLALTMFSGCNDENSTIGSSLVTDKSEITVDSAFTLTGRSVATTSLRARTLTQLIGSIDARSFGTLRSDYVTQLMPSASFDTTGVTPETVDSIILFLRYHSNAITGDSLTPMGVDIFPLTKQLPEELQSDFDPTGYYDPSKPVSSSMYVSNHFYTDSFPLEIKGIHLIEAKLPIEIGRKYVELFRKDPSHFATPQAFTKLIPGIYVANSFGSGRVTNIFDTRVTLYFHSNTKYTNTLDQERDTTIYSSSVIAASAPEVLTNNNLSFTIDPSLTALAATEPILVSPLGYESTIKMPMREIIASFKSSTSQAMGVVNSLTLRIPVKEIDNDYGIEPPAHILLVPTKDRDKFFAEQQIPDNVTSFIADYYPSTKSYYFSGLRPYFMHLMSLEQESSEIEALSELSIVPVEITSETYINSSYQEVSMVTAVGPHIEGPAMARLDLKNAKIKLTFSKETVIF